MGVRTRSVGTTQGPVAPIFLPPNLSARASPYPCNVKKEEECPGLPGRCPAGAHTGLSTLHC